MLIRAKNKVLFSTKYQKNSLKTANTDVSLLQQYHLVGFLTDKTTLVQKKHLNCGYCIKINLKINLLNKNDQKGRKAIVFKGFLCVYERTRILLLFVVLPSNESLLMQKSVVERPQYPNFKDAYNT
jgi:hypothetical protein